ncbi:MAG: transposase [Planctomycetes bacterium]|nr:transposase [Planctomycetota bacterium]
MPQSLAQVYVHIVFATKNRAMWLCDADVNRQLYAYMATVLRDNVDSPALLINGVEDHIHALVRLSRRFPIMDVIKMAKTETTKWLKRQSSVGVGFAWQSGYGAFSVSASQVDAVTRYISDQMQHHSQVSFQDEFRQLCRLHGVELDERYAWD